MDGDNAQNRRNMVRYCGTIHQEFRSVCSQQLLIWSGKTHKETLENLVSENITLALDRVGWEPMQENRPSLQVKRLSAEDIGHAQIVK